MLCQQLCLAAESELVIQTTTDNVQFNVVVADTPEKRSLGLMHQPSMAENVGMLFDYQHAKKVSMWMKNTAIPLDMIFINEEGVVVKVHHNAVPYSHEIISSEQPVLAVLEINAGLAKKYAIKTGSTILHELFDNQ